MNILYHEVLLGTWRLFADGIECAEDSGSGRCRESNAEYGSFKVAEAGIG